MTEALNEITTIVVDAAIAGLGIIVAKWLNAWANKHKSEAESNQMNDLRDVTRVAANYVEEWARSEVKKGLAKPESPKKLSEAIDWVCQRYPKLMKDSGRVKGFVLAAVKEINENGQRWDESVARGVEAAVKEMKDAEKSL